MATTAPAAGPGTAPAAGPGTGPAAGPGTAPAAGPGTAARWRPSRGLVGFASALLVYAGARVWNWAELEREKAVLLGQAHLLAEAPLDVGAAARRVVVIRNPGGAARYQFDTFVKPVLDAAAIDYTCIDARDPDEAREAARTIDMAPQDATKIDGVVIVGTTIFRGALQGLLDRVRASPPAGAERIPVGYVPLWHVNGIARGLTQFTEASMLRLLGEAALAVAQGARRPVTQEDLERMEALANHRLDRRTRYTAPGTFKPVPPVGPDDPIDLFALPAAVAARWHADATARWHAAGGYWSILPPSVRALAESAGLVQPSAAPELDDDLAARSRRATQPLRSVRDLADARRGQRPTESIRVPDEAAASLELALEEELVRSQLEAVGVRVTADPRPIKLPKVSMYPNA